MSSGESKDLRVAERGQLAKVYLRRTEGQALCLQLAAEKLLHMPEWRKTSGPLLLKLFWHVVAREMGGRQMTLPQAAIAPPYQPDRSSLLFSCWCISVPQPHSYEDPARHLLLHLVRKLLPEPLKRNAVTDRHIERKQISSNQKANSHITLYPAWDYWIKEAICSWPQVRRSTTV